MADIFVMPRLPLDRKELFPSPMAVMPPRPGTPGSVRLTSSVTLTSRLPHDLSRLSATSLITLQLAERVPLRTFYDGLFRFPCHYGIQLYRKAAEIFDRLQSDYVPGSKCNLVVEDIDFSCNEEKKLVFELAYAAMKYEGVLRQTLDDVGFAIKYPEFQDDLSLASVILYDYQDRRFQRRRPVPSDQATPRFCRLEEALFSLRTRLSAALARIRILHDAPSLRTLLPADLQPREVAKDRPLHCWVNANKTSPEEALDSLWTTLKCLHPGLSDSSFHHDEDFSDLLVFEPGWKETIQKTAAFRNRWIVLQEKACCLPAYAAVQELRRVFQREPELRGSLLQIGAGSGRTLAHVVSRLPSRTGITRVLALAGDRKAVVERQLHDLGVRSARVLSGELDGGGRSHELRDVVAVLVTPETTHTALVDPVEWVIEEGGDISLLRELSMDPSQSALPQRVSALVTSQNETLLRALRLPHVRVVVYATHSANRAENEEVVFGVVDEVNEEQRKRWEAERDTNKLEIETPPDKLYEFRQLVNIPDEDIGIPFLVLPQTSTSSGVFIAVIVKNLEFIRRQNRSVIDDAVGMGMLDKVGPPLAAAPAEGRPSRRKLRRPKAAVRSERLLVVGRREPPRPPPAAAAAAPPPAVPLHVHVPHLHDCTCVECARRRRSRVPAAPGHAERQEGLDSSRGGGGGPGGRGRGGGEASPGGDGGGSVGGGGGGGGKGGRRRASRRPWFQSLAGSAAESSAPSRTSVASLQADGGRTRRLPTVVQLQVPDGGGMRAWPDGRVLTPIPGSGHAGGRGEGERERGDGERARLRELEAVGRLEAAADGASREAIRAIREQMEGAWGVARWEQADAGRAATLRDLHELASTRLGAQLWWAQPRRPAGSPRSAGLRPHVRQLLASRGRPDWRYAPEERPPERPPVARRRRQASQPPAPALALAAEPAQQGDATGLSLPRLPRLARRSRHLSLGPPLNIHKVNIGDMVSLSFHAPPVF